MTDSALTKKLLIRPNHRVTLFNAPIGFADRLAPLPDGAIIGSEPIDDSDVVVLFAQNQAILQRDATIALSAGKPDGVTWLCFPKGTSKLSTDISRDAGWRTVTEAGYIGVSLVSIDDTWSAFR